MEPEPVAIHAPNLATVTTTLLFRSRRRQNDTRENEREREREGTRGVPCDGESDSAGGALPLIDLLREDV